MESRPFLDRLDPKIAARAARRAWIRRRLRRLQHWGRYLLALLIMLCIWSAAHIYYYNKLIDLEFNVQATWAQVEVQWQRRYHIQQNLAEMVVEYAKHERSLLTRLTQMRTGRAPDAESVASGGAGAGAGAAAPTGGAPQQLSAASIKALKAELEQLSPKQLNKLFPSIQIAAEQYPALRLSENFQQFSATVVETETTIAQHIESYNSAVNIYTTLLKQFPAIVFGTACGFVTYEFYRPGKDDLAFRPVKTELDG